MRIGIIGAGQIGGTLVRRFRALRHDVTFSNSRSPQTLSDLANETGATAVWAKDAATDADLVIVSIPQKNVPDLVEGIVAARKPGAPVIETNNYYPQQRDGEIAAIEDGQLESEWVAEQIGAPVYKVFNGIWWKHLLESGTPSGTPGRIALPIAGENGPGRVLIHEIVDQLGFEPVDAGPISESWRQQPGTPVYGKDFDAETTLKALAEATRERTSEWSAR
ncbi:NADPH-dependent F420 reductase [Mycolicibacterium komossense]|uniref:NAD(P)-binding domain-containing protein n=1 Tax=Mycolicibacterium komossense TaxID=1779 RepID=A0ABT3CF48_9MYCO|nr:NAD(P)-binding domain-containing protein [Mycolicibacterium komossense]MCV7228026.1 NAD(P)-binding domain-containing protein [Mycolicibacterium komossense]